MHHIKDKNGFSAFTLIELLVILAIVSILATVTYASIGSARGHAKDKSVTASMQGILIEANLYHSKTGSYTDFCTDTTTTRMGDLLGDITAKAPSAPDCEDTATTFGVIVELHGGNHYCVDSSKVYAETNNASLASGQCNI